MWLVKPVLGGYDQLFVLRRRRKCVCGRLCSSPLCSRSWWFFSSFTGRWAWLPRAPRASRPDPALVTGGMPGGCRPEGCGGSWTGGPWAAWERCWAWSCCCCKQIQRDGRQDRGQVGRLGSESMNEHTLLMRYSWLWQHLVQGQTVYA